MLTTPVRNVLIGSINRFARWYSYPEPNPNINVNGRLDRFFQFLARLYAKAELPRHVQVLEALQVHREPLWLKEGWRECRGIWHGYTLRLNIADFYQRWAYFLSRYHEFPLQVVMLNALKKGDVFIDGGANNGLVTLVGAWLVGPHGAVHAFEPNVTVYDQTRWHVETNHLNHVTVHKTGLSDVVEELVLQVPGSGNWGAGTFSAIPDRYEGQIAESCTAKTMLGDSLLPSLPKSPHEIAIKLDVEGFELRALQGFDTTLRERRPLVMMEMNAEMLGMNNVTFDDVFKFMNARGYRCFAFREKRRLLRCHGLELTHIPDASHPLPPDVAWLHPESGMWNRLARYMAPRPEARR